MTYPGPGSRGSMRSVRSVAWDEVVDAIITADVGDRNSRVIADDAILGPHQPTIDEVEESDEGSVYSSLNERIHEPIHSSKPSVDATTLVNAPGEAAEASSSKRGSRASMKFDFDIKLSDNLDTTLRLPEDADIVDEEPEDMEDAAEIESVDEPEEPADPAINEKEPRLSRSGSHSGSSTVHEEQHTDELPSSKEPGGQDLEAGSEEQQAATEARANFSAFPTKAKRFIVVGAASASIFAPLSMQIYLPSLTTLVTDFGVTTAQINLTVSVYMIFMAISPMIMGGIADVIGRRPAMLGCFSVYLVSCVMIALCQDYKELMGFRILQSIGASPTIAIASAVVADIVTAAERGSYAALVAVPVIFAPTLGPVIGGLLTQYLGWRSIFWFLLIAGAVGMLLLAVAFPETCRVIVGDASAKSPKRYRSVLQAFTDTKPDYSQSAEDEKKRLKGTGGTKALLWQSLTSAVRVLCTRERFCLLFYVGLVFSGFQAIATELPTQFKAIYGFDHVMIGVMYLPLAGGAMISTAVFGKQMNKNFRKYAARAGVNIEAGQEVDMNKIDVEKARLEITMPSILISTVGIVCWGWVLEAKTTIAAPCVLLFFMGVGLNGVMATTNALLMDISQSQAGAVMAASNLTRCALGAVASAAIQMMIDKLGLGWTYVVFGIIFIAFSPMLAVHYFKGWQWRAYAKRREDYRLAALEGRVPEPSETIQTKYVQQQQDMAESQPSPKKRFFSRRTDKQSVKAAAVEALVTAPGIPLVEMTVKEEEGRKICTCGGHVQ